MTSLKNTPTEKALEETIVECTSFTEISASEKSNDQLAEELQEAIKLFQHRLEERYQADRKWAIDNA